MNKIIKIPKKLLKKVNKDIFTSLSNLFEKKISNHNEIFKYLKKNPEFRSSIFDLLNMLPVLSYINYEVKNIIEKKFSKNFLVNWTYPQIRLDDVVSSKFMAPAHKDRWIINEKKSGYVAWMPLKETGSSLLISKNDKIKKIVKNNYWGLEALGPTNFIRKKINYGEALIFDPDLLHKSDIAKNSRITLQLRYEEIEKNNFRRTVTQKVDPNILKYWKKKLI